MIFGAATPPGALVCYLLNSPLGGCEKNGQKNSSRAEKDKADVLSILKYEPRRNPSFLNAFYGFEAPEKNKSTARWGGSLPTCLRNRRFHRPLWSKSHIRTESGIVLIQYQFCKGVCTGGSEFDAVPAATGRSRHHRSRST